MSGPKIDDLVALLELADSDPEWKKMRHWLAINAPFSAGHLAMEHLAELCVQARQMIAALTASGYQTNPGHTVDASLFATIEEGIHHGRDPMYATTEAVNWRLPKSLGVIGEYESSVMVPPRCGALERHRRCIFMRHDDSMPHKFEDE